MRWLVGEVWHVDLEPFDDELRVHLFGCGSPGGLCLALADLARIEGPEAIEDLRMIKRYFSISNLIIFIIFI